MTNLRSYLSLVKKAKELKLIKKQVSTKYEVAGITAKLDGREAVLFENIKESNFRLVSNLVGTRKRFALAIGSSEEQIHETMINAIQTAKKPKIISSANFFQNKSNDLSCLPIVTHFEKESGPFITSSIVYAKNPESGEQNSSFHRMMPIDNTHFSISAIKRNIIKSSAIAK